MLLLLPVKICMYKHHENEETLKDVRESHSRDLTSIKACGLGQFCCLDNLSVRSAAVRPSLRATALKNPSSTTGNKSIDSSTL